MAAAQASGPPPRSWRCALLPHALGAGAVSTTTSVAEHHPVPTATGPVTRRTFRASRRSSRPRPWGMSGSSTTRSRGSSGSSGSCPARRSATVVTAAAPTAVPTSTLRVLALARHDVLHEQVRGERHDQRRHAHGEARGGVVLRVVGGGRARPPRRAASGSAAPPPSTRSRRGWRRRWDRWPSPPTYPAPPDRSGGSVRRWGSGRAGCCPSTSSRARRQRRDRHRGRRVHRPPRAALRQAVRRRLLPGATSPSTGTHACDYLLTTDLEMEPVAGYRFAGWDQGYGDVHLVPDLATLRVADWLDRTALVLCDVHHPQTHELTAVAPRTDAARAGRRARATRATRRWRPPSSSTTCSARPTATPPAPGTPTSSPPAGTSRTTSSSRAPAPSRSTRPCAATSPGPACRSRARRASGASASTR